MPDNNTVQCITPWRKRHFEHSTDTITRSIFAPQGSGAFIHVRFDSVKLVFFLLIQCVHLCFSFLADLHFISI